jgi:hypothetical protein
MSETRLDFSGTFYRMPSIAPVIAVHTAVVHGRSFGHARRLRDDPAQIGSTATFFALEKPALSAKLRKQRS